MIKTMGITELTTGMYVESVVKQRGNIRIKSKGLIKSQTILDALKDRGILEVQVNFAKSTVARNTIKVSYPDLAARSAHPENYTVDTSSEEHQTAIASQLKESKLSSIISDGQHKEALKEALKEADKLYTQAKNVQKNFVSQLHSGSTPNIDHLNDLSLHIIDSVFDNADALSCLLMLKDSNEYLVEHAINCAILLTMFASSKGMSQAEIEALTIAGLLMDIGMASLPNELLEKTSELDSTDWTIMKSHVDIGLEMVERLYDAQPIVLDVIADHHERINGSGYPKAKTVSQISEYAQMAGIVDCYDAMISNRHHQRSVSATAALHQLENDETLDDALVNEFINAIGLHPVGSLVQLNSNKLAIVSQRNVDQPLNPIVMIFYSMQNQLHTDIVRLNLSQSEDYILTGVRPEEFSMNLDKFFKSVFLAK